VGEARDGFELLQLLKKTPPDLVIIDISMSADLLFTIIRTVQHHRANIMKKLKIKKTTELLKYAIQEGYTELPKLISSYRSVRATSLNKYDILPQ
jgi:DNA-binding NarL/FixJ family response regulator